MLTVQAITTARHLVLKQHVPAGCQLHCDQFFAAPLRFDSQGQIIWTTDAWAGNKGLRIM